MSARLSAEERRDEIVAAAATEFAASGFAGTPTEAIARRVGVSQPYLFQLFGTKKDLFIAAVNACFEETRQTFVTAGNAEKAAGGSRIDILEAMGHAYIRLLMRDPAKLRMQLQAYAAGGDADIRNAVRRNYGELWATVHDISGASQAELMAWFAQGMLINVVASIGDGETFEDYLRSLLGGETKPS